MPTCLFGFREKTSIELALVSFQHPLTDWCIGRINELDDTSKAFS